MQADLSYRTVEVFRHALAAVIEFSISQYNPINSSPTISGTKAVSIPPAAFRLRNKRVKSASSPLSYPAASLRSKKFRRANEFSRLHPSPPAGFAMPGGGSPFCPDLRIVPLRHRKRPAPRPSAVSAEKQAQHRPLPLRPHFPPLSGPFLRRLRPSPAATLPTTVSALGGTRPPRLFFVRAPDATFRPVSTLADAGFRHRTPHAVFSPAFRTCRPKPVRASKSRKVRKVPCRENENGPAIPRPHDTERHSATGRPDSGAFVRAWNASLLSAIFSYL